MQKSLEIITDEDLKILIKLAREEHKNFFKRNPELESYYKNSLLCILLGQGAALHYYNGKYGVKDFDVYLFYKENSEKKLLVRRTKNINHKIGKFGNIKIDFIKKMIKTKYIVGNEEDVLKIINKLLTESKSSVVKFLTVRAKKEKGRLKNAIIGLYPVSIFKKILWEGDVLEFV